MAFVYKHVTPVVMQLDKGMSTTDTVLDLGSAKAHTPRHGFYGACAQRRARAYGVTCMQLGNDGTSACCKQHRARQMVRVTELLKRWAVVA